MTKVLPSTLACLAAILFAGCKEKAQQAPATVNDTVAKMTDLRDRMCACKDAECARRVSDDMTAWSQQRKGKLSPEDQKRASELGVATGECMKKVSGVTSAPGAAPVGSAADTGTGSGSAVGEPATGSAATGSAESATGPAIKGLPQECLDYKAAIDKLATCEKITKQARETLVKAYMDSAPNWANLPESSKANMKVSCKAGAQSVLAVAKQHCGW